MACFLDNARTFTTPVTAAYFRIGFLLSRKAQAQLEIGSSQTVYVPYANYGYYGKAVNDYILPILNSKKTIYDIIVDINGTGDYTSLTTAVENANEGDNLCEKMGHMMAR